MGWQIDWTEPALQDLGDLVRYIAKDEPATAIRIGDKIVDHVEILKSFPEIGPVYKRRKTGNVRQMTRRPFRIFYRIRHSTQVIEILHIWHGSRRDPGDLE